MAAGNTVSRMPDFGAVGSVSEGTIGFPVRDAEVDLGAQHDYAQTIGGGDAFGDHGWQTVEGVG
jgi:hypothetical protein